MAKRYRVGFACFALTMAISMMGCTGLPRVTLQAPAPEAPLDMRRAAYRSLRPTGGATYSSGRKDLFLASGTTVYHPGDLLAVVPKDSKTAKAAQEFDRHHRRERVASWTEYSLLGASVLTAILGTAEVWTRPHSPKPYMLTSGAFLLGYFSASILRRVVSKKSNRAATLAYAHYESDLVKYLNVQPQKETFIIRDTQPGVQAKLVQPSASHTEGLQLSAASIKRAPQPSLYLLQK